MNKKLIMKNRLLVIISLILFIIILILCVLFTKYFYENKNNNGEIKCENNKENDEIIKNESLDNYDYVGIYNNNDNSNNNCIYSTTLVLTSDYNAIFYVGDCNNKTYYYGKYRISENKIYLYSLVLEDSSSLEELKVKDDEIYFNLTNDTQVITSIYGRNESIRLEKMFNVV